MKRFFLLCALTFINASAYGVLAGGRPNSISGGINAFAGVVNPANAVWIENRLDVGMYLINQRASMDNRNNNPLLQPGKTNMAYKSSILLTGDFAIHRHFTINSYDTSFSLATYSMPGYLKVRTKEPVPIVGTTPILVENHVQVASGVFSIKINQSHSVGASLDYFYLSHRRNGFQRSDNILRSVSPGHVTNNGMDHSGGFGFSLGWRWNMTKWLAFGAAFVKESYVGQYRKYRGYEPHRARNYIPMTLGAGFTCRLTQKLAGRLEVLWTHFGALPNANNTLLSNGDLNLNRRGSKNSPGAGLQDATILNLGLGYKFNTMLSIGAGWSHRIKLPRKSPYIVSRPYTRQTIYDIAAFGANFKYKKHELFLTYSHGFANRESGYMPPQIGGGKFVTKKSNDSVSVAYGYLY